MRKSKEWIRNMFGELVFRYEFMNNLFSLNINRYWRWRTRAFIFGRTLDICTGTGEMIKIIGEVYPPPVGLDFSMEMLRYARRLNRGFYVLGDAERLPFNDETFDSVTMAFGLRNILNVKECMGEIFRVLRPGGRTVILDMTRPTFPLVRFFYKPYLFYLMPLVASIAGLKRDYYIYLGHSIWNFSNPLRFKKILEETGFTNIRVYPLTFGLACIFVGEKNSN
jgi:demethylmenaquinone methyltransferase/2-methoxy-6-polyprenyl-1,4-benzoquinol methylase